ncbi:MAG: YjfI family protein [Pseudomonadota bacterium]
MNVKTSAHYQREYRRRLREQGLVKKEIWIRPEHADRARAVEKALRDESGASQTGDKAAVAPWRTGALYDELMRDTLVRDGHASIELIEGIDPTLHLILHDYGDLPVFVSVAGDQIIAESVLWPVLMVHDAAEFNETVLRTHKYFPLSTICLGQRMDQDYYLMFGSLSSESSLKDIVREIEVLASNVIHATEAYVDLLQSDLPSEGEKS